MFALDVWISLFHNSGSGSVWWALKETQECEFIKNNHLFSLHLQRLYTSELLYVL